MQQKLCTCLIRINVSATAIDLIYDRLNGLVKKSQGYGPAISLHHFLQVTIAQRASSMPANAHPNDVKWEAQSLSFGALASHSSRFVKVLVLGIDPQTA